MTVKHKPYSLAFDMETTRPGEQTFAEPEPPDAIGEAFGRRLRDVERAGRIRNRVYSAGFGAAECAHFCRHTLHDAKRAASYDRAAAFYLELFRKVCRLEARARGEAVAS